MPEPQIDEVALAEEVHALLTKHGVTQYELRLPHETTPFMSIGPGLKPRLDWTFGKRTLNPIIDALKQAGVRTYYFVAQDPDDNTIWDTKEGSSAWIVGALRFAEQKVTRLHFGDSLPPPLDAE